MLFNIIMNLSYNIKELTKEKHIDIDELINEINEKWRQIENLNDSIFTDKIDLSSRITALELDYDTNYTVKMLKMIMDYYQIAKRKMVKNDMVQSIILFEEEDDNKDIVKRRKRRWEYVKELKDDNFFSKYVIFNF